MHVAERSHMRLKAPIYRLKRQARVLSRESGIPLHKALDEIATTMGYRSWSQLAKIERSYDRPAARILSTLKPGTLVTLSARPGHGKTVLGLEILKEAASSGRSAGFVSSEFSLRDVRNKVPGCEIETSKTDEQLKLHLSDRIAASYVVKQYSNAAAGAVVVIDFLQVMDQHRSDPPIGEQVRQLKQFASDKQMSIVFLSQIHRSFNPEERSVPDFRDMRKTNPLDLGLFDVGFFLHEGVLQAQSVSERPVR